MSAMVCAEKRCGKDCFGNSSDDCPYAVLHLLDNRGGFQERKRQCGKTTELMKMAEDLIKFDPVYFITYSHDMAENIRIRLGINRKVKVGTWREVNNGWLRGMPRGFVLLDEVIPDEFAEIEGELLGHKIVASYWSKRD